MCVGWPPFTSPGAEHCGPTYRALVSGPTKSHRIYCRRQPARPLEDRISGQYRPDIFYKASTIFLIFLFHFLFRLVTRRIVYSLKYRIGGVLGLIKLSILSISDRTALVWGNFGLCCHKGCEIKIHLKYVLVTG